MGDQSTTAPDPHGRDETLDEIQKLLARSRKLRDWSEELRVYAAEIEERVKRCDGRNRARRGEVE